MRRFLVKPEDSEVADVLTVEDSVITINAGKHIFRYQDDGNGVKITDARTDVYLDYGTLSDILVAATISKEVNGANLMDVTVTEQGIELEVEF